MSRQELVAVLTFQQQAALPVDTDQGEVSALNNDAQFGARSNLIMFAKRQDITSE
jgi:hypothetical protein